MFYPCQRLDFEVSLLRPVVQIVLGYDPIVENVEVWIRRFGRRPGDSALLRRVDSCPLCK